ncbi:BTB/POZ domain-containing protein 6-like [Gigantopelta aegis]|uniref:BTB/POZ domain-containing protein 6-like n=1 Tax=Gigantopelta aegis TaxID=1735272 RepID=UPI001B88A888|nr:BTB/POZ domain-containing protein 6-like [Gigantopelta aegis]XP_041373871.1 BTB/POZ domain-containing protein 6-like [Gigantopelta aegis]XP_041373872.1 BTB/POZ domain-containing protein 6-like [Gigantopelta aegis]
MATKVSESEVQSGFVENWQKGKSVIESLRYSLEEKILCDVTFIVGENRKRIQAHRFMLSLRSCVFLAMLTGPLVEQDNIEIPDIDPDVFDQFLKFLYTDDVSIDGNNVIGLLYASKKYNIVGIEKKCLTYMESSLLSSDVCLVMEQAHLYNENNLMQTCLKYIWQNGDVVLKSDSFCDLCLDCFVKVIEADQLNASEESVFEAVIVWSEAECRRQGREITPENRRGVLGESVYEIRYSTLDPKYFDEKVSHTCMLTKDEQIKIMRSFLFRNKDISPFKSKHRVGKKETATSIQRFDNTDYKSMPPSVVNNEGIVFSLNTNAALRGFQVFGYLVQSFSVPMACKLTASMCETSTDQLVSGSSISKDILTRGVTVDVYFPSPIQLVQDKKYNLTVRIEISSEVRNVHTYVEYGYQQQTPLITLFTGKGGTSVVSHGSFTCSFYEYKQCSHLQVKMATKESESEVQSGFVNNWQNGKSVRESLRYSLEEKILCDVTFIVGENRKRIQAHRLILSLRSCVFMAMLTGPLAEQDDIEIPDIDSDGFDQLLRFLYTDVISIDGRNVISLLYASKKYDIVDIENKCLTYIESSMSPHEVCFVMEQAHL